MSLPWNEKVVSFQLNPKSATVADIVRMAEELIESKQACKAAKWLYDQLAMGPLDAAVKYGDMYEPPNDEKCLEIREMLERVCNFKTDPDVFETTEFDFEIISSRIN